MGTWGTLLGSWRTELRARGIRQETIRTWWSYLARWSQEYPPAASRDDVIAWLANPGWAPATRKAARSALRSFYRWAVRTGRLEDDPTVDVDPVRVPRRRQRRASDMQLRHGLAACCPDTALMVALAGQHGLRRAEIARIRRDDLTWDGDLIVHGKGGKDREVPLLPHIADAIAARPAGYLFPGRFGGHIHPDTVHAWIREATGVGPHALRRRFATAAYASAPDLLALSEVLGHSSPETTAIYVGVRGEAKRRIVAAAA